MTRLALLALSAALAATPAHAQSRVQILRPDLVESFPHDVTAFTQGLFASNGQLFESTGQFGESNLREVELGSGTVLRQQNLPASVFGEGSARIGDEIYVLTWMSQTGFVYDANSFEQVDSFTYAGEGWGLTTDGQQLILSDGSPTLRFLDPTDMSLVRELEVTLNGRGVRRLNELEWIDGEIWANVWMTDNILRIDPQSGMVTSVLDMRGLVPEHLRGSRDAVLNGIAYDAENDRIFVTGKLWPVLHEIRLPAAE